MKVIEGNNGGLIKAWVDNVLLEDEALQQLHNMASMPFIHKYIAVMPDVHAGHGATIGSVIPSIGAVIPAAVGVDIGCGMMAVKTNLTASDMPDNLSLIRCMIEYAIPHGRTDNGNLSDRGAWGIIDKEIQLIFKTKLAPDLDFIVSRDSQLAKASKRAIHHLGTLGGGNHFIELCLDENQAVWIMLHSGSRGIGNAIGTYFINLAKKDMQKWFINLPDKDLAYIPYDCETYWRYINAVKFAQSYAETNRIIMMKAVIKVLEKYFERPVESQASAINCHHNYISNEYHHGKNVIITRKGAVHISPDTYGIIPGSMGAKSFIVRGIKGQALADSFNSCSHGAGRIMSRTKARAAFTLEDHIKATEGVECRKDSQVIDETPGAYKDIDAVMAAQSDHVEIVHTLKQILCIKG